MQDRQEDRPFHRKRKAPGVQQRLDHRSTTGLLSQPLEHLHRPDAPRAHRRHFTLGVRREPQRRLGEARPRGLQRLELAAVLQMIQAPRLAITRCLIRPSSRRFSTICRQIGSPLRGLDPEKHDGSRYMTLQIIAGDSIKKGLRKIARGTTLSATSAIAQRGLIDAARLFRLRPENRARNRQTSV